MRAARLNLVWRVIPLLGLPLFTMAPDAAQAQGSQIGGVRSGSRPTMPTANLPTNAVRRDVAPALPGAVSSGDTAAPPDRPAMEMRPTEALFDAINRGDITAARDAIGRGAELNGRNILGFTPLETAVDLGRKDIVFLLLSQRGMDDRPNTPPPSARVRPGDAAAAFRRAQMEAEQGEDPRRRTQQPPQQASRVAPQPTPPTAQRAPQYANDSGSPSPDAGFLGFDGGRGGRARP